MGEMILMVGSLNGDEIAIKSCWRQGVLTMEVTFDSYTVIEKVTGGETRSLDWLSELTTRQNPNPKNRQNPNPKNSYLFYGFVSTLSSVSTLKSTSETLSSGLETGNG